MWTNSSKAAAGVAYLFSILRSGSSFAGVMPARVKGSRPRTVVLGLGADEVAVKKRTPSDEMEKVTAQRVSATH